jgi:hypothetical protein
LPIREILWLGTSACSYAESLPKTKNAPSRGQTGLQYYDEPPTFCGGIRPEREGKGRKGGGRREKKKKKEKRFLHLDS